MPDLLVVVLEVGPGQVRAALAPVDRPGEVVREAAQPRGADLLSDVRSVLGRLGAGELGAALLAVAVAVGADVDPVSAQRLRGALGPELRPGWPLPATLPVLGGSAEVWAAAGAGVPAGPLVAGAVVAAARSVGAHAHLPGRGGPAPGGSD